MDSDELLCITGGDLGVTLDGYPCPMWQPVTARKNSMLRFSGLKKGLRFYICFKGGIHYPTVLGSSSTLLVASRGIPLEGIQIDGDGLPIVALIDRQTAAAMPARNFL